MQFYGSDDRDDVRLLLTQGGGTGYYAYKAFDEVIVMTGSVNPFQFAGNVGVYQELAAALSRSGARIYDPVTGRWISMDRIGFDNRDWNLHRYVMNNPVTWRDSNGYQIVPGTRTQNAKIGPLKHPACSQEQEAVINDN